MSSQTPQTRQTTPDEQSAVDITEVAHSFGDVDVLSEVTARIDAGTVACLIGPNGSGKTTLLRLIAGLLDPDEGTIEVAANGDRAVGYLAQQPEFRAQFTVRETLAFYSSLVETETDVDAVLDRVGLTAVADRRVDALSGGMLRLLAVAQTTIGDPRVLVLDEPTSGLDPTMTRHIIDTTADIADEGVGVVLATHDLRSVERVADKVLVLSDGEVVAADAPTALVEEVGGETLEDVLTELTDDAIGVSAGLQGGGKSE